MFPASAPNAPTPVVVAAVANPRLSHDRSVRGVVVLMLRSYLQERTIRQIPWRDTRQKKKDRLPMPQLIGSVYPSAGGSILVSGVAFYLGSHR